MYFTLLLAEPIKINLITTNDIHGMIAPQKANFMNPAYPPTIVGGAAFSKYIDGLRSDTFENGEGLLIVDGGNFYQGTSLGMADRGRTMITWMNRIGYNALVPGKSDFISGAENLNSLAEIANFPFLFSNLECSSCPLVSSNINPFIIKEISGVKVGILGIANSQLDELVLAESLQGTAAKKEASALRKWIPEVKNAGAEIIILLNSSGVPWDRSDEYIKFQDQLESGEISASSSLNALQLGYFSEGVDFMVAGGNSKGYPLPWYDPNSHVYIMQGYGNGTEFSHVKLLIDRETHLFMGYETIVDGRASQTLLADDFQVDRKDAKWIDERVKSAAGFGVESVQSMAVKALDYPTLEDNWDFPQLGSLENVEIMTWNCEFFPHANDSTIKALAEAVNDFDVDIIAFQEIRRTGWFSKLMAHLPQYEYIVSQQTSFMDLALIYKSALVDLNGYTELFADDDYNFAGRPPLLVNLVLKRDGADFEFTLVNLHMKCCDSGLERRKKASAMLHEYLNENHETLNKLIVLGDWNDDTKDAPGQHCFQPFFNDDRFYFITADISYDLQQASYPKPPYVSFLDHIMVSEALLPKSANYSIQTIRVGDFMGGYANYEAYISDHRPVLLSFKHP